MAEVGRVKLGAGNETANAAAILTGGGFVGIDLEVPGVRASVRTNLIRWQITLKKFVPFVAILKAERNIQVTGTGKGDLDWFYEVRVECVLVRGKITRAK